MDQGLLLYKLQKVGIVGRMYSAISAMYKCPRARVILNNISTNWFSCSSGVKQGDTISPTLFSVFVNDLIEELNSSGSGISLEENFSLACLAYADDIVLLAPNENSILHESDRERIGTLEQNMQGPSKTNTRTRNLDVFTREELNL